MQNLILHHLLALIVDEEKNLNCCVFKIIISVESNKFLFCTKITYILSNMLFLYVYHLSHATCFLKYRGCIFLPSVWYMSQDQYFSLNAILRQPPKYIFYC